MTTKLYVLLYFTTRLSFKMYRGLSVFLVILAPQLSSIVKCPGKVKSFSKIKLSVFNIDVEGGDFNAIIEFGKIYI